MIALALALTGLALADPAASQEIPDPEPTEPAARTGWDLAAVPLINFTTDRGVGYGLYGAAFYLGPDGPGDAPYLAQIGGQFYRTTGGYRDHKFVLDLPRLAGGLLRADVQVGFEAWDGAFYFGLGNTTPRLRPADTPEGFYTFGLDSVRVASKVRLRVAGDLEVFFGHLARSGEIAIYPGSRLDLERPVGSEGGLLSQLQAGALVDTRDHEVAPTEGVFSEVSARFAAPWLGSTWAMWGANATDRRYLALGDERDLVLATRAALDLQIGELPFFHQMVMGGSQWVDLGGPLAMRGLPIGRYRGELSAYGDVELRWGYADFAIRDAGFRAFLVPFVGAARASALDDLAAGDPLHGGAGLSARLLYNEVFLARMDVAAGLESYADPADPLGATTAERGLVPGVYLAFNAPY